MRMILKAAAVAALVAAAVMAGVRVPIDAVADRTPAEFQAIAASR